MHKSEETLCFSRKQVKELSGDGNITNVTHCATRLRFILKDESVVDSAKVSKIPEGITTVQTDGQYQAVIGNHVKDAFDFVMELVTVDENVASTSKNKVGIFNRIVDIISSIFAPFLYTLAACGTRSRSWRMSAGGIKLPATRSCLNRSAILSEP